MTGQTPDTLIYKNTSYAIVGMKGEEILHPIDFGLEPRSPHTGNWRGYVMRYKVQSQRLLLDKMDVYVEDLNLDPPKINDVKPTKKKEGLLHLVYKYLNLQTKFTGGILIGKDFIYSMYVHMGFQSPISHETVFELVFENGILISRKDLSKLMKEYREKGKSDGKLAPNGDVMKWISRTFSLDYEY